MQLLKDFVRPTQFPMVGVSIKPSRGYNPAYPVTDAQQLSMVQAVGAKIVRIDVPWADVEQKAGKFTWGSYLSRVNACKAAGIQVVVILGQGNPLYTPAWNMPPTTADAVAAFARYAVAAVGVFGANYVVYEVYNEPNLPGNWGGTANPTQYGALLSATSVALRAARPDARVVSGGLAVFDPDTFIASALKCVDLTKISAVGFHPYTGADDYISDPAMAPGGVPARFAACRAAIGAGSPNVWNTEQGFELSKCAGSTISDKLARQGVFASLFVLSALLSLQNFAIWYDLVDDGTDMTNPEYGMGLFDFNFNMKPSGKGFKAITDLINGSASATVSSDGTTYVAKFTGTAGKVSTVTWSGSSAPVFS
jgi:hypothetical protein